jgi:hypothetical protein
MDTPTLRILNTLSSNLGEYLSINQLTERIKDKYGTAHYANIYQSLQELKNQGLVKLNKIGRSSNVELNFQNYLLMDTLAEIEIEKKRNFLSERNQLIPFLAEMHKALQDRCTIKSVTAMNPASNMKLNRIEFLFLLNKTPEYHTETLQIYKEMQKLQNKHNLKINTLITDQNDFHDLLTSDEINPLREALTEQITFFCPQTFWTQIKQIAEKTEIKTIKTETKPASTPDSDLAYNLNRFGYREFGRPIDQGKRICLEYITTTMLLRDDARLLEAIPIILAKNTFKTNPMTFLTQKYETTGKLLGLLKILQTHKPKPEIKETIDILETLNIEEVPADEESILQKMRLYHAL